MCELKKLIFFEQPKKQKLIFFQLYAGKKKQKLLTILKILAFWMTKYNPYTQTHS